MTERISFPHRRNGQQSSGNPTVCFSRETDTQNRKKWFVNRICTGASVYLLPLLFSFVAFVVCSILISCSVKNTHTYTKNETGISKLDSQTHFSNKKEQDTELTFERYNVKVTCQPLFCLERTQRFAFGLETKNDVMKCFLGQKTEMIRTVKIKNSELGEKKDPWEQET